jgi:hypothetical protein
MAPLDGPRQTFPRHQTKLPPPLLPHRSAVSWAPPSGWWAPPETGDSALPLSWVGWPLDSATTGHLEEEKGDTVASPSRRLPNPEKPSVRIPMPVTFFWARKPALPRPGDLGSIAPASSSRAVEKRHRASGPRRRPLWSNRSHPLPR